MEVSHKDELLNGAAENVKRTKIIAEQLGRTLLRPRIFVRFFVSSNFEKETFD